MQDQSVLRVIEARRDGPLAYYRVFVDEDETPSLVFVDTMYRTSAETALKEWCKRNLAKLLSGKIIEAIF